MPGTNAHRLCTQLTNAQAHSIHERSEHSSHERLLFSQLAGGLSLLKTYRQLWLGIYGPLRDRLSSEPTSTDTGLKSKSHGPNLLTSAQGHSWPFNGKRSLTSAQGPLTHDHSTLDRWQSWPLNARVHERWKLGFIYTTVESNDSCSQPTHTWLFKSEVPRLLCHVHIFTLIQEFKGSLLKLARSDFLALIGGKWVNLRR